MMACREAPFAAMFSSDGGRTGQRKWREEEDTLLEPEAGGGIN